MEKDTAAVPYHIYIMGRMKLSIVCDNKLLTVNKVSQIYMTYTIRRKNWKSLKALKNVSFSLSPGLYGLLGPNGAGKTTLLKILIGGLKPTHGNVKWNGRNIINMGKCYRRLLGYMPQQHTLYESFTGKQLLEYFCALKEIPAREVKKTIQRVSGLVSLENEIERRIINYSGGMKQRLLAATALIGNPQIIIMDEPTVGFDPKERVKFRNMLMEYAKYSIVLVATHVVSDLETVADQVLLLGNGKLIANDTPNQLIQQYAPGEDLEGVYLNFFGDDSK